MCSTPVSQAASGSELAALTPHEARYEVWRRGSKLGDLTLTLEVGANGEYHYRASTEATSRLARMLRVGADESARFAWRNDTIVPLHYQVETSRPGRQRFWEVDFDWTAGYARRQGDTDEPRAALESGVIDPLTLRLKIAMTLAADPRRETDLVFSVMERKRVETHAFRPNGFFNVTVPAGCMTTLHLEQIQDDADRELHSWHAAGMGWLPVRVRQLRDGREEMDLLLAESSLLDRSTGSCD